MDVDGVIDELPVASVLVNMPVSTDGVTSSPGLEFGSLIWAVMVPPVAELLKQSGLVPLQLPGAVRPPLLVSSVQTVLFAVAAELPLLCAQTEEEPNNATAEMARQGSITLVIIEQFFIIFSSCFAALKDRNG